MARPLTMKKDGIQTRNRKLSAKSKKKRGSVMDFFSSPFDAKPFGFGAHMSGGGGGGGGYLPNPMSSYYGGMSGMAGLGTNFGMGGMYGGQIGGGGGQSMAASMSMQMSAAGLGGMAGGYPSSSSPLSAAMQHSVIGAMT